MPTLRQVKEAEARIEYAMYCPEVGILGHGKRERFYAYVGGKCVERSTRESLASVLVRAWDSGVKTGS